MSDLLAAVKRERNKQAIMSAYTRYVNSGDESELYAAVYTLAKAKFNNLEREFGSSLLTADELVNEVVHKVFAKFGQFKGGTPEAFYAWVHRICYARRADAANALIVDKQNRVPLEVPVHDDEFDEATKPNPELDPDNNPVRTAVIDGERRAWRHIPEHIQGTDRCILELLMCQGRTFADAAYHLNMTEPDMMLRLANIGRRMKARRKKKERRP